MKVLLEKRGPVASIIINRPDKLNILNQETIQDLVSQFRTCQADPDIKLILLTAMGDRAFSAGGDVKEVYYASKEKGAYAEEAFDREFDLNMFIEKCDKVIVSHLKGIAMGGGVAITLGGDFALVDETTHFALPEIDLAMIPDVGLGYYISKLDQDQALFLTLLGRSIDGPDAVRFGFASHYIANSSWDRLAEDLHGLDLEGKGREGVLAMVEGAIRAYAKPLDRTPLDQEMEEMAPHFNKASLGEILQSLEADPSEATQKILGEIRSKCPIASNILFEKYFAGKKWDRVRTFEQDRKILKYCFEKGNMAQGIEATLIHKKPTTYQGRIEDVDLEEIRKLVYG